MQIRETSLRLIIITLIASANLLAEGPRANDNSTEQQVRGVSIERAGGATLSRASGHFARARSLLIAAVREFDLGYKLVDPSALIHPQRWRATLLDRAEDMERILSPQPRASSEGVRYNPDPRLLGGSN